MGFFREQNGAYSYLVYQVEPDDVVQETELNMLKNNRIDGLLDLIYTQNDDRKLLKYNITSKLPASELFRGIAKRKRVLGVLSGVTKALRNISNDYQLMNPAYVMLDLNYIFADVSTFEASAICVPVSSVLQRQISIPDFFRSVVSGIRVDTSENCDYVAIIINYLNGGTRFDLEDFYQMIESLRSSVPSSTRPAPVAPQEPPLRKMSIPQGWNPSPMQNGDPFYGMGQNQNGDMYQNPIQSPAQRSVQSPYWASTAAQNGVTNQTLSVPQRLDDPVEDSKGGLFGKKKEKKEKSRPDVKQKKTKKKKVQDAELGFPIPGVEDQELPEASISSKPEKRKKSSLFGKKRPEEAPLQADDSLSPASVGGVVQPQQSYGQPQEGYGQPQQSYGQPQQSYGQPQEGYGQPQQSYGQPQEGYGQPQRGYGQPQRGYGQPQQSQPSAYGSVGVRAAPYDDMPTDIPTVSGDDETTFMSQAISPYLIRQKTNEKISIEGKEVFRLGRGLGFNDYVIADNRLVGRAHCHIVCRNGEYFVVDDNSKNHTLVNGTKIVPGEEVKIMHGQFITLANEEFVFHMF